MEELLEIIAELRQTVKRLEERVAFLEDENARLRKENAELKQEIERLKNPKNSRNSSIPPSMDPNRPAAPKPNQSLRPAAKRASGGQKGHKGRHLEMSQTPNQVVDLKLESCRHCQHSLSGASQVLVGSRQVVDVPPILPTYTQYDQYQVCCPNCASKQVADFPKHVKAPIQYGPGVMAQVAYLSVRHCLPMHRVAELLGHQFSLPISVGTIDNHLWEMGLKGGTEYATILQSLLQSRTYVGADETGCRIEGRRHWMWVLENELYTLLWPQFSRDFASLNRMLPEEYARQFVLVHDCYTPYFKINDVQHQICLAHIRRDLQYLKELDPDNKWVRGMDELLLEAIELKKTLKEAHPDPQSWEKGFDPGWRIERKNLERRIQKWIASTWKSLSKEVETLKNRLIKHRDHLTTFLHHYFVPPDNNGSERAIRNVKVKTKISGQFRTMEGAETFAILRSVIDTAIKQGQDPFLKLVQIAGS